MKRRKNRIKGYMRCEGDGCNRTIAIERNTRLHYCVNCFAIRAKKRLTQHTPIRYTATKVVSQAIRDGKLQHLSKKESHGLLCQDCNNPAQCWDHRDYSKPLNVDPVCFSCNLKRGSGKHAFIEEDK